MPGVVLGSLGPAAIYSHKMTSGVSESRLRDLQLRAFYGGMVSPWCLDFVPLLDRMRLPYVVQGHGIDVSASGSPLWTARLN